MDFAMIALSNAAPCLKSIEGQSALAQAQSTCLGEAAEFIFTQNLVEILSFMRVHTVIHAWARRNEV